MGHGSAVTQRLVTKGLGDPSLWPGWHLPRGCRWDRAQTQASARCRHDLIPWCLRRLTHPLWGTQGPQSGMHPERGRQKKGFVSLWEYVPSFPGCDVPCALAPAGSWGHSPKRVRAASSRLAGHQGTSAPGQGGCGGDQGLPPLCRRWKGMDAALGAHGSMVLPWSVGRWGTKGDGRQAWGSQPCQAFTLGSHGTAPLPPGWPRRGD